MSSVAIDFYLIVGQNYDKYGRQRGTPSIRTAKNKPACQSHEVSVMVSMQLPESLFKRPTLAATIIVPDDQAPAVITPEIVENITRTLREQAGIVLHIQSPEEANHE